jgi:hypothetical protein
LQLLSAAPAKSALAEGLIWLRIDGDGGGMPAVPLAVRFGGWQRAWLAVPEATSFLAMSARPHATISIPVTVAVVDGDTGVGLMGL